MIARPYLPDPSSLPASAGAPADLEPAPTGAVGRVPSRWHQALSFLIGLFLPVLCFRTEYVGTPIGLWDRITVVDLLLVLALVGGSLSLRLERLPVFSIFYLVAIGFAAVLAFARSMEMDPDVYLGLIAMMVAFGYYLLGLNLGSRPILLRRFLLGLALATLGEAVIVYHDSFFPNQWYPDPMEGRARGTFKASGQLAAFAFSASGMLLILGESCFGRRRALPIVAGLLAASFGILASRRSAMIVLTVWGVLVLVFAWPHRRRLFYRALAGSSAALVLAAALFWPQVSTSFAAKRLVDGVEGLASSEGFIQNQFSHALKSAPEWFPWGFGPGKGKLINREDLQEHEIHNGLLAVVVELGAFGMAGFLGMILGPLPRLRRLARNDRALAVLLATFLLTSLVFMLHNTLFRDRTFLIFIGILSGIVRKGTCGKEEIPA